LVRIIIGKEDFSRIKERIGFASRKRPNGKLIWVHATSVGESKSSLDLIKQILNKYKDSNVLVTTVTRTSAEVMEQSLAKFSDRAFHQYIPVDKYFAIKRFLKYWKPDILLLIESDIWPNLIFQTGEKNIPIYFINARISEKSFSKWQKNSGFRNKIFSYFTACFPQSKVDEKRFGELGLKNIEFLGNLKYDGDAPNVDRIKLSELEKQTGDRQIFLASSTHKGEEKIVVDVYKKIQKEFSFNLLLIIVPRHPSRLSEITKICEEAELNFSVRSKMEKIKKGTNVYIADTLGELGLFYTIAAAIFLGGSMVDVGGHNPLEPAKLKRGVVTGHYIKNCTEIYEDMLKANASIKVINEQELFEQIKGLLGNYKKRSTLNKNAYLFVKNRESTSEKILRRIFLNF
jgi:3-deoxy-D-manno-octulosonic-acid transferase